MRKLLSILTICSTSALAGSIGGSGGTPAIQLTEAELMNVKAGILRDDLIKITSPTAGEIYLKPNKFSLHSNSISARILPTGEDILLELPTDASRKAFSNTMESLEAGASVDVETVPVSSLDEETLSMINLSPTLD